MKIGIVTLPLWGNYGGILQNYALQYTLRNLGHDPITFDLMPGSTGLKYLFFFARNFISWILGRSKSFFLPYAAKRNVVNIEKFVSDNITVTPPFWNTYSNRLIISNNIDVVIVGSDQVWRPKYSRNLKDMYLAFCKSIAIKKISYAASFGTDEFEYSSKSIKTYSKLLKYFNAVSVREKSGVSILQKLGRDDAIQVLDPTLLLTKETYNDLLYKCNINSDVSEKYLGAYILTKKPETNIILEKIRKSLNLDSIQEVGENNENMSPADWIYMIKKARVFVTDSFHGTVFCILYQIPFVTIINYHRGADRFISLLEPLGLSRQMVSSFFEIREDLFCNIDWSNIDKRLDLLRKQSLDFLKANII